MTLNRTPINSSPLNSEGGGTLPTIYDVDVSVLNSTSDTNVIQYASFKATLDSYSSSDTQVSQAAYNVTNTSSSTASDYVSLNTVVQLSQTLYPTSEVSVVGWTGSYSDIGEPARNDATYITTNTAGSIAEYNLTIAVDPISSTGHIPTVVLSADAGGIIIRLKQGATVIKTWTYPSLPSTPTEYTPTLSTPEIDSITDYTNLRISFESTV
jgi:hypothetical protein